MGGGTKLICVADKVEVPSKDKYTETSHMGATTITKYYYDYDISSQIAKYPNLTLDNILITKKDWNNPNDNIELHPRHKVYWLQPGADYYRDLHVYDEAALQGISNGRLKLCLGVNSHYDEYDSRESYHGFTKFSIYILTGKVEWV